MDTKENISGTLNTPVSSKNGKAKHGGVVPFSKKLEIPGQVCSPVQETPTEEDDEAFTTDFAEMDNRLSREAMPRSFEPDVRRQTLHPSSKAPSSLSSRRASRRTSTGGRRSISASGRDTNSKFKTLSARRDRSLDDSSIRNRRVSFGGHASISRERNNFGIKESEADVKKLKKLNGHRINRLNDMDIKLKSANSKLNVLQEKYTNDIAEFQSKYEEMKKKHKIAQLSKRRAEVKVLQCEEVIRTLRVELKKYKQMSGANSDDGECFREGSEVLGNSSRSLNTTAENVRRYTMAPGEVTRIGNPRDLQSNAASLLNSCYVRVEGLKPGTNSKKLLEMCRTYGDIAQLRVMKDGHNGRLKGYISFLDSSYAKIAVDGLNALGYKAMQSHSMG